MKRSEKESMFNNMQFDNAQYAQDCLTEAEAKQSKVKTGLMIAAAATVCSLLGWTINGGFLIPGLLGGIVSYIIGGGFLMALGFAKKIAVFGWIVVPFPLDLVSGLVCLAFSLYCFLFFPLAFVYMSYRQVVINKQDAEKYLSYCK